MDNAWPEGTAPPGATAGNSEPAAEPAPPAQGTGAAYIAWAENDPDEILLRPITHSGPGFYVTVAVLLCLVAWGAYAYVRQYIDGLGHTGLNRPIFWGVYITNFVFFVGISHAGTLISAILRIAGAEWRRPITRCAEVITTLV